MCVHIQRPCQLLSLVHTEESSGARKRNATVVLPRTLWSCEDRVLMFDVGRYPCIFHSRVIEAICLGSTVSPYVRACRCVPTTTRVRMLFVWL